MMKRTSIWLPEEMRAMLRALSRDTGAPVSVLIRKAIQRMIEKQVKESK